VQTTPSARDKIIVALDVPTSAAALALVEELGESVRFYKIGLQLFTKTGPGLVTEIRNSGARVFLDLKFHDIPNTVEHAVRSACDLGLEMMTIHLAGGARMIRAAAAGAAGSSAIILGVTVLTSMSRGTLRELGISAAVEDQVLRLARLAVENGLSGVVASPLEISLLRQLFGAALTIVTPGIRPSWAESNDQQRTLTPAQAARAGADYLVIGRPITGHASPREAVARIIAEMETGEEPAV